MELMVRSASGSPVTSGGGAMPNQPFPLGWVGLSDAPLTRPDAAEIGESLGPLIFATGWLGSWLGGGKTSRGASTGQISPSFVLPAERWGHCGPVGRPDYISGGQRPEDRRSSRSEGERELNT